MIHSLYACKRNSLILQHFKPLSLQLNGPSEPCQGSECHIERKSDGKTIMSGITEEEECIGNIIPLFSTNILPQGKFTLPNGQNIVCFTRSRANVQTTNRNPDPILFVDDVWPGSRVLADFLVNNVEVFFDKHCLELGAGCSLPSLVAAALGAKAVVISDYPANGVIENISDVISANHLTNAIAIDHIWGEENTLPLMKLSKKNNANEQGYDVIFLAELLWKDTYLSHRKLLESITTCLNRLTGIAFMAFAHRPTPDLIQHTPEKDQEFFSLADGEFGLECCLMKTCCDYYDVGEVIPIEVFIYSLRFKQC